MFAGAPEHIDRLVVDADVLGALRAVAETREELRQGVTEENGVGEAVDQGLREELVRVEVHELPRRRDVPRDSAPSICDVPREAFAVNPLRDRDELIPSRDAGDEEASEGLVQKFDTSSCELDAMP